jgi:hypothetical protein
MHTTLAARPENDEDGFEPYVALLGHEGLATPPRSCEHPTPRLAMCPNPSCQPVLGSTPAHMYCQGGADH